MSPDAEVEEQLVTGRPWPRWVIAVAVLAGVAAVAVLVKLPSDNGKVARPTVANTPALYGLTPAASGPEPDSCPSNVLCSVLSTWPRPLVDAIEAHLAGAIVRRVHSVEYVSPIEHREAVWYREVLLSFESTELVIVVQQPRTGARNEEEAYRVGSQRAVRIERAFFDRYVVLRLDGAGQAPTLAQLRALAADERLVAA